MKQYQRPYREGYRKARAEAEGLIAALKRRNAILRPELMFERAGRPFASGVAGITGITIADTPEVRMTLTFRSATSREHFATSLAEFESALQDETEGLSPARSTLFLHHLARALAVLRKSRRGM